ncbi:MAG: extracellular solute-binding protein [Solirubrobacterales bacterium]|nr:extracellular solute-binding protein [Solirubrobacterales bacterium]
MSLSSSNKSKRSIQALLLLALIAFGAIVVGCGSSDDDGGSGGSGGDKVQLVAYSTPQTAYEEGLEPAFNETDAGKGVSFSNSFGASGDQSRAVEAGQPAGYVNFALETDVTRLVDSGQVSKDWQDNKYKGIVTNSVVSIVTRPGNPEGVKSFQDIIDKDLEVVTPNPFTSGGARWNIMAIYGAAIHDGQTPDQALDTVKQILSQAPVQPASARDALQAFVGGAGDVLISYENEAIAAQNADQDVDYVVPDSTILIEQPAAVTVDAPKSATDFLDFLWSDEGQKIWAEQGYRPVNKSLVDESKFPTPKDEFTIAEFGGWDKVADEFFDDKTGSIAEVEKELGVSTEG